MELYSRNRNLVIPNHLLQLEDRLRQPSVPEDPTRDDKSSTLITPPVSDAYESDAEAGPAQSAATALQVEGVADAASDQGDGETAEDQSDAEDAHGKDGTEAARNQSGAEGVHNQDDAEAPYDTLSRSVNETSQAQSMEPTPASLGSSRILPTPLGGRKRAASEPLESNAKRVAVDTDFTHTKLRTVPDVTKNSSATEMYKAGTTTAPVFTHGTGRCVLRKCQGQQPLACCFGRSVNQ